MTYIRLLLRVGIKVVDEWQISLDYVRGSNIYVRGYLDLRAWSLRLRTKTDENHYVKVLFPSREQCFSLRCIRGILAIRRRACVALRRDMSGSWACDALAHKIEGSTLGNNLILVYPSYHYWFTPCTNTALIVGYIGLKHHSIATHQTTSANTSAFITGSPQVHRTFSVQD